MDIDEWMGWYARIVAEFGFDVDDDSRSAQVLERLVRDRCEWDSLGTRIAFRDVIVVGAAVEIEPPTDGPIIAADGATTPLLEMGIVPDVIVTDLDGRVNDQVTCSSRGANVVIHAHGDNIPSLEEHVPRFPGPVCGTTQVRPFGALRNFGGFTDGDRAVMMAEELGSSSVRLAGFRFDVLGRYSYHKDPEVKMAKLAWARRLIAAANVRVEYVSPGVD